MFIKEVKNIINRTIIDILINWDPKSKNYKFYQKDTSLLVERNITNLEKL